MNLNSNHREYFDSGGNEMDQCMRMYIEKKGRII